uniref:Uncharacterized protein n=1 Tax=Pseudomonas marincola TaxID=437900 RepID=A0A653DZK1_9PSED
MTDKVACTVGPATQNFKPQTLATLASLADKAMNIDAQMALKCTKY